MKSECTDIETVDLCISATEYLDAGIGAYCEIAAMDDFEGLVSRDLGADVSTKLGQARACISTLRYILEKDLAAEALRDSEIRALKGEVEALKAAAAQVLETRVSLDEVIAEAPPAPKSGSRMRVAALSRKAKAGAR